MTNDIILNEFLELAKIPRPSHHEERISRYLYGRAVSYGLKAEQDEYKNVIIDKPASPGYENAPRVILQAHMDMVAVADEGVDFDPVNDPILVENDGEKLTAKGTSLGADDGMGVAICLYLLQDDTMVHGPLRVIFTADEEDGMDSMYMDPKYLDGKYLINLDWEQLGSLCNSCAGGDFYHFIRRSEYAGVPEDSAFFTVTLKNLLGGHSGVEIHKGHANALVALASLMTKLSMENISFRILSFTGGQASNAIPKSARICFAVNEKDAERVLKRSDRFRTAFLEGFKSIEEAPVFEIIRKDPDGMDKASENGRALTPSLSADLVNLMAAVPCGIHTMSPFINGLVESSANPGMLMIEEEKIELQLFARSSSGIRAEQIGLISRTLARAFGFELKADDHVPGWAVNPDSELTRIACAEYRKLTGEEMVVEPVHAGLECGAFALKNPALDMIAIGPTLSDVHTPKESCCLADVKMTADLTAAILRALAEKG